MRALLEEQVEARLLQVVRSQAIEEVMEAVAFNERIRVRYAGRFEEGWPRTLKHVCKCFWFWCFWFVSIPP